MSLATDSQDGNGRNLKKFGQIFQLLPFCPRKVVESYLRFALCSRIHLIASSLSVTGALICVSRARVISPHNVRIVLTK